MIFNNVGLQVMRQLIMVQMGMGQGLLGVVMKMLLLFRPFIFQVGKMLFGLLEILENLNIAPSLMMTQWFAGDCIGRITDTMAQ